MPWKPPLETDRGAVHQANESKGDIRRLSGHILKTDMSMADALLRKTSYNLRAYSEAADEEKRKKYAAWISYDMADLGRLKMDKNERERAQAGVLNIISDIEISPLKAATKIGIFENMIMGLLDASSKWNDVRERALDALVGQVGYLSHEEKNLAAMDKIELMLRLKPQVALIPAIKAALDSSINEQIAFVTSMAERDVWEAGTWARDYKTYTIAGVDIGPAQIRYDPPHSELLTEELTQNQKRDDSAWPSGDSVPAEQLPVRMAEMTAHYFESQVAAAGLMGKNADNETIRDLAAHLQTEAGEQLLKAKELGGAPEERRDALLLLVNYYHDNLQPALAKMETEKYFSGLYRQAGNSILKKTIVWMNEHAETGKLWSALAIGAINPLAGRMAFISMGSRDAALGIESGNWNEALISTTMLVGLGGLGRVSKVAGGMLAGGVGLGTLGQLGLGAKTGFTPRDLEGLANNAVLLEGFYRARMGQDMQKRQTAATDKSSSAAPQRTRHPRTAGKLYSAPGGFFEAFADAYERMKKRNNEPNETDYWKYYQRGPRENGIAVTPIIDFQGDRKFMLPSGIATKGRYGDWYYYNERHGIGGADRAVLAMVMVNGAYEPKVMLPGESVKLTENTRIFFGRKEGQVFEFAKEGFVMRQLADGTVNWLGGDANADACTIKSGASIYLVVFARPDWRMFRHGERFAPSGPLIPLMEGDRFFFEPSMDSGYQIVNGVAKRIERTKKKTQNDRTQQSAKRTRDPSEGDPHRQSGWGQKRDETRADRENEWQKKKMSEEEDWWNDVWRKEYGGDGGGTGDSWRGSSAGQSRDGGRRQSQEAGRDGGRTTAESTNRHFAGVELDPYKVLQSVNPLINENSTGRELVRALMKWSSGRLEVMNNPDTPEHEQWTRINQAISKRKKLEEN